MLNFSTFGGSVKDRVLAVTQSDDLREAHRKLTEARQSVEDDTTGNIDGVEPWETKSGALQRLDHELLQIENLLLDEQIEEFVG